MADDKLFPKTLYVQAGSPHATPVGRDYFGKANIEQMNDGDGAWDGETVAVYELREVKRVKVTRELVDG